MSEEVKLSANAQKVLDLVSKLSILEVSDLVKAMEETFGVTAAAPAAVMAAGPAAGGDAADDAAPSKVNVVLVSAGGQKIAVIKVVKEVTGLGLGEAKALVDAGGNIKEGVDTAEWEELKAKLEEAGATVELK